MIKKEALLKIDKCQHFKVNKIDPPRPKHVVAIDGWINAAVKQYARRTNSAITFCNANNIVSTIDSCEEPSIIVIVPKQLVNATFIRNILKRSTVELNEFARRIGVISSETHTKLTRTLSRLSQKSCNEGSLVLYDDQHTKAPFSHRDGLVEMTAYNRGLEGIRVKNKLSKIKLRSLSGRLPGRFHSLFLSPGEITSRKKNEYDVKPSDIKAEHIFFNTCCASIYQEDTGLTDPLSISFLDSGARSYIGSTRIHAGFPYLEYLYPRLLNSGFSLGSILTILNAVILNSGFDSPVFVLFGDPEDRIYNKAYDPPCVVGFKEQNTEFAACMVKFSNDEQFIPFLKGTEANFGLVRIDDINKMLLLWSNSLFKIKSSKHINALSEAEVSKEILKDQHILEGVSHLLISFRNDKNRLRGSLVDIKNTVSGKRKGRHLKPPALCHRRRFDASIGYLIIKYCSERNRKIIKFHKELLASLNCKTDNSVLIEFNYYDQYQRYLDLTEPLGGKLKGIPCPMCGQQLYQKMMRIPEYGCERKLGICSKDFIVYDFPCLKKDISLPFQINLKSDNPDHLYEVIFHNPFNYSVLVSLFTSISYINDVEKDIPDSFPSIVEPFFMKKIDPKTEQKWDILVHNIDIDLSMYILQALLIADTTAFYSKFNYFKNRRKLDGRA